MFIGRMLSPIFALGPGKRLVIWMRGCSKHCMGCANPDLWDVDEAVDYAVDDIATIVRNIYQGEPFDGITISGGDPLEQADELLELLDALNAITEDIIVYTGFVWDDFVARSGEDIAGKLKERIAVLIDGPYVDEENLPDVVLRGSANQRIIYFKERYRTIYEEYLSQGRKVQNVYMGNQLVSVGIHNREM